MADPRGRRRRRAGLWALGLCLGAAALLAARPLWLQGWQERAFDALILTAPLPDTGAVTVIDIGRTDERGDPWSRAASARLAARLAEAGPRVIGWDIVFAGGCGPEAANLALAATLGRAPNVLGFLLANRPEALPGPSPQLALSASAAPHLWAAPGAEGPCPGFVAPSVTLGGISLPGDAQARVRAVPVALAVGGVAWPSLVLEVWRRALGGGTPLLGADRQGALALRLGDAALALDSTATLRVQPRNRAARAARTLEAAEVLRGAADPARLAGRIVLVGSSLPQAGGLRPTAIDPLYPSVQIAADALDGLAAGRLPHRPAAARWAEALALALGGLVLAGALARLAPLAVLACAFGLAALWSLTVVLLHARTGWLIDPAFAPLAMVLATLGALSVQAALATRAERALRLRMGQLLPQAVVARLADAPDLLRLTGERREVTALFTDLEGFSSLARSLPPEGLIALLDRYFTVINAEVLRHGGMIDKIVGDAVHALFNAPLDQPSHVEAALDAAAAISAATEAVRAGFPGLGRTRIGIETGPAILGDVGSGGRIDYTAHGDCVNLAARLQEAGKVLGPAIIIGPAAAAQARRALTPLGEHALRSFGPLSLFTLPVPPGTADREPRA